MKSLTAAVVLVALSAVAAVVTSTTTEVAVKVCYVPAYNGTFTFPSCTHNCTTYRTPQNQCLNVSAGYPTSFKLQCQHYPKCIPFKAWLGKSCTGTPGTDGKFRCDVCQGSNNRGYHVNKCHATGVEVKQGCDAKCTNCQITGRIPFDTCFNPVANQTKSLQAQQLKRQALFTAAAITKSADKIVAAGAAASSDAPSAQPHTAAPSNNTLIERIEVKNAPSSCEYVNVSHYYGAGCPASGSGGNGAGHYELQAGECNDQISEHHDVMYSCVTSEQAATLPMATSEVMVIVAKHQQKHHQMKKLGGVI